jgi:hypothetical protein
MAKRYPRSESIQSIKTAAEPAYATLNDASDLNAGVSEYCGVQRSQGMFVQDLSNIGGSGISARPGLDWNDYGRFRPGEARAATFSEMMTRANLAYKHVGIVQYVVDLMAEFACQGIRLVHPNKRIEKFYQNWFKRVCGEERSERFLNNLYRLGNVVVRKQTAKINLDMKNTLYKTHAKPDLEATKLVVKDKEIPWKYTFLDPSLITISGGALASFIGDPLYAIKLPDRFRRTIRNPKTAEEKSLVGRLPFDVLEAAKTNKPYPIPPDKISVFHYKKDDWEEWACPMVNAVLDDVAILQKLKLADIAALDGAISNIRIFKLGNLEHRIAPKAAAAAKLSEILQSHVGGGTIDLVWGPDIELVESKTNVHLFLGEGKYIPHLNSIYTGLGVPSTTTSNGGGTTNNYISMKTLMKRIEYGRSILVSFWEKEILAVQRAMGFRFSAKIEFDIGLLGDENAERTLLIQMADRNLISDEYLQWRFGHDPEMEGIRIKREQQERADGKMVPKASPYHDPQFGIAFKKIALQTGILTPGQVGLRKDADNLEMTLYNKTPGEKTAIELKTPAGGVLSNIPQPKGRPKNSKDSTQRTRTFTPKIKAAMDLWVAETQNKIDDVLKPLFLAKFNKANKRQLSDSEVAIANNIKFDVLCSIDPFTNVNAEIINKALNDNKANSLYSQYSILANEVSGELNRSLTLDEKQYIESVVYVNYYGEKDGTD